MTKTFYLCLSLLTLQSCINKPKHLSHSPTDFGYYKIKIEALKNTHRFNDWCEFHLKGEEGTLNYMDVMHLHELIGSGTQHTYGWMFGKKDILGKYFLDLSVKDTSQKIYNLCVDDFSDDFETHLICRIQKDPKHEQSRMIHKKAYYHGNYPCSDSWEMGKFTGFGRLGKYHYYFGHCGTGSGFCSEQRIILNSNCEEFAGKSIPYYLWSYYETGFSSYYSEWTMVNDSTLRVLYFQERGTCTNEKDPYCDIEKMKKTKTQAVLQFKFRNDTIVCSDTTTFNQLGLYW